jgi:hypothetical protein
MIIDVAVSSSLSGCQHKFVSAPKVAGVALPAPKCDTQVVCHVLLERSWRIVLGAGCRNVRDTRDSYTGDI